MKNYSNLFGVQRVGESLIIGSKRLAGCAMSRESALNLAAHLVHLADESDGSEFNGHLHAVNEALPFYEDEDEGEDEDEDEDEAEAEAEEVES